MQACDSEIKADKGEWFTGKDRTISFLLWRERVWFEKRNRPSLIRTPVQNYNPKTIRKDPLAVPTKEAQLAAFEFFLLPDVQNYGGRGLPVTITTRGIRRRVSCFDPN